MGENCNKSLQLGENFRIGICIFSQAWQVVVLMANDPVCKMWIFVKKEETVSLCKYVNIVVFVPDNQKTHPRGVPPPCPHTQICLPSFSSCQAHWIPPSLKNIKNVLNEPAVSVNAHPTHHKEVLPLKKRPVFPPQWSHFHGGAKFWHELIISVTCVFFATKCLHLQNIIH